MKINDVIKILEEKIPLDKQENWDNSGWQICFDKLNTSSYDNNLYSTVNGILIAVTVDDSVLDFAINNSCNLIISHHPIIFPSIKLVNDPIIIKAIQNNISIYSTHTNYDKYTTSKSLANYLGFFDLIDFNDYIKIAKVENFDIDKFIIYIKEKLCIEKIKIANYNNRKKISSIGICAGSGGDFLPSLGNEIDLFISSDLKYHQVIENSKIIAFDIGHLESEVPSLKVLYNILINLNLKVFIADEKNIWSYK